MRFMAVDPGDKRLGIAISDPTGQIANPLTVLYHVQRAIDAATIAQLASEHTVDCIIVGQSLDEFGDPTPQGRKAARLADAIRQQTHLPVVMWDEGGSTQTARQARLAMGVTRQQRKGHMDDLAATVVLQTYLDHFQQTVDDGG